MSAYAAHSSSNGSVEKIDSEKTARNPFFPSEIPTLLLTISLVAIGALPLADFDDPNINKDEAVTGVLEDDSPYPEVRSAVANTDDMSIPVSTFRAWPMGQSTLFLYPSFTLSQFRLFLGHHYPWFEPVLFPLSLSQHTGMVVQLLSFPMGHLWAAIIHNVKIFGVHLNPGPFTIMATVGWQSAYVTDNVAVQRVFYGQTFNFSSRFGSVDLPTARILPDEQQQPSQNIPLPPKPTLPPPSKPVSSSPSSSSSTFTPVNPSDLAAYVADPSILILDIRPHAAYTAARLHRALSLSIPSTLIKRPLFGLSKLVQMLHSSSARARFAAWPNASHILVYDADSVLVPDTSNIAGLLREFRAEGFTGEHAWVKGGFQAVWREARHCVTTDYPSPDEDEADGTTFSGALRTKHLPKATFSLSTTTAANAALGTLAVTNAANPFFDTIRQNLELSQGITERIPLRLPRRVRRRINDLPFRWLQDIAGRSALRPSHSSSFPGEMSVGSGSESSDDPHDSDPDSNDPDVEEGAETLAMQFYRIEVAEQRRLRSVMEHHARESEVSAYAAAGQAYTLGEGGQGIIGVGARSATVAGIKICRTYSASQAVTPFECLVVQQLYAPTSRLHCLSILTHVPQ
ncbi:hypothetical protein EDD22DRAFT_962091 [Suillus occidentalis]|nr:hypothetical protein EDD22DRAFT_962091 [Suillus occidentalis]